MAKAAKAKRGTKSRGRATVPQTTRRHGSRQVPVPQLFPEIPHVKKRAFLTAFVICGSRTRAAEMAGCDRKMHLIWLRDDPAYAQAFAQAELMAAELAEEEAWRRGIDGIERGVWYKGERVGSEREYSDTLLIFQLKGLKPMKYRDRSAIEHDLSPALAALLAEWDASAARPAQTAAEPPSLEAEWAPMLPCEEGEM